MLMTQAGVKPPDLGLPIGNRSQLTKIVVVALAITVLVAVILLATHLAAGDHSPASTSPVDIRSELAQLHIANNNNHPGYARDLFPTWLDLDGNGCSAREDVLIAESTTPAQVGAKCTVKSGSWTSIYDGVKTTNPNALDIDHMVPLAEAWRSGAYAWTAVQRAQYANDIDDPNHLIAVSSSSNRSKGDSPPNVWRPPSKDSWCRYAKAWVSVKVNWSLTATTAERDALGQMLETC